MVAEGTISGQGNVFLDQMVRYPLLLTLNEIFAKDKKQKEEKVVTHAAFTVDLSVFMTGNLTKYFDFSPTFFRSKVNHTKVQRRQCRNSRHDC